MANLFAVHFTDLFHFTEWLGILITLKIRRLCYLPPADGR
jgi:hypothetical protein